MQNVSFNFQIFNFNLYSVNTHIFWISESGLKEYGFESTIAQASIQLNCIIAYIAVERNLVS